VWYNKVTINAKNLDFTALNEELRSAGPICRIEGCLGQRFIAAGMKDKSIEIYGVPGNALGAYLGGGGIVVYGNAQDAVGDTMNAGLIVIHGHAGDAAGYAMRGGEIYIKGNAGYRAGIHMKEYREKKPVMVIGGRAGSFLGEYQAGGIIIVLGLHDDGKPVVGNFPCTGMHGGKMVLRGEALGVDFPSHTKQRRATDADMSEITPYIERFCGLFGYDTAGLLGDTYTVVTPDSNSPYKQMYVEN